MVAGDEKIRFPEVLQNVLQQIKFLGVTEFSDIAAEDGEVRGACLLIRTEMPDKPLIWPLIRVSVLW